MTKKQAEVLAEFFAGPMVAHHSVCLQLGGAHGKMARVFFETREKLGIRGWTSKEEAISILMKKGVQT